MKLTDSTLKFWLSRCLGFLLMVTGLNVFAGNLTASVDRDSLGLEETFTLVLRYDEQVNATPDYELLQKDFDILNTQSGTQMSIINGSMEASTEWKIALAPKRIGKLLIPSFNIEGAVSDAIEITVEGKSRKPKDSDTNVSVEMETSVDAAYVQQQVIVTLRLYTTVGLSGIELQPMQVKDALVVQLDEKQYQTKINNRPGAVVETRYAVFPQQSGELVIPSMLYQVSINQGARDVWDRFYGNNQNNILRLRTDEQRINVLPAPAAAAGSSWMPAKSLELSEHWSVDVNSLKVGEPVTRTITIKADGLTAGQITPLEAGNLDGITFYKDQAQSDDQKSPNGVVGTRTETIAIVPTKEGTFTLPQTEVRWWNTHSQMMETAYLNAVTLKVGGGAASQQPQNPATTTAENTEPATDAANSSGADENAGASNSQQQQIRIVEKPPIWLYITNIILAFIAGFFAIKYWQSQRAKETGQRAQHEHLRIRHENESNAWNHVKRQLADKSLTGLRKAIIDWAKVYWHAPDINGLQAVAGRAKHIELSEELRKLDEAIFGNQNAVPDLDKLLQILANLHRDKQQQGNADESLKPLYP